MAHISETASSTRNVRTMCEQTRVRVTCNRKCPNAIERIRISAFIMISDSLECIFWSCGRPNRSASTARCRHRQRPTNASQILFADRLSSSRRNMRHTNAMQRVTPSHAHVTPLHLPACAWCLPGVEQSFHRRQLHVQIVEELVGLSQQEISLETLLRHWHAELFRPQKSQ